jgi:hypothetical protein
MWVVPPERIELSTSPLPRVRSTTELWRHSSTQFEGSGEVADQFRVTRSDRNRCISGGSVELGSTGILDQVARDAEFLGPFVKLQEGILAFDADRDFGKGTIEPHTHEWISVVEQIPSHRRMCALRDFLPSPHLEIGPKNDHLLELTFVFSHGVSKYWHGGVA